MKSALKGAPLGRFVADDHAAGISQLSSRVRLVQNQSMIRVVDFRSKDRNLFRCLDSDFDGVTVDPGYFDVNSIADYDSLLHFS